MNYSRISRAWRVNSVVFNSVRAHVVFMQEPNAKEYLQLALARILELQREIKDGTYATDHTSDLGNVNIETYYTILAASSLVFSGWAPCRDR